jgi:DNA polymerase I-like protein with 3'-5' exonuclease and polymerase domains
MIPENRIQRKPFVQLLANENIKKIAHNLKFEETWSKVRLRQSVKGWNWDTMLMAHILDNRRGVTGLKFQTYVYFGIADYSSEIEPYLISVDPKDGNSLNRIEELIKKPGEKEKLLKYCALDSIFEYRLAQLQKNSINQNQ